MMVYVTTLIPPAWLLGRLSLPRVVYSTITMANLPVASRPGGEEAPTFDGFQVGNAALADVNRLTN